MAQVLYKNNEGIFENLYDMNLNQKKPDIITLENLTSYEIPEDMKIIGIWSRFAYSINVQNNLFYNSQRLIDNPDWTTFWNCDSSYGMGVLIGCLKNPKKGDIISVNNNLPFCIFYAE